jgi:predicted Zn-dependent protease
MRIRTFLAILCALALAVVASHLTQLNRDVLYTEFRVGSTTTVPIYLMVILVFLAGFLPPVVTLVTQTLRRDLQARKSRKLERETKSLDASFRRAVDLQADGQWAKSLTELEPAMREQGEDFSTLLVWCEALCRSGRAAAAVDIARRASVLFPQSVAVLYQLAEAYRANGEPEVAREIHARVLRDFPGQGLAVLRERRAVAIAAANWPEAMQWNARMESLLQAAGDQQALAADASMTLGLRYQKGVLLLESEQLDEAIVVFREVLAQDPRFVPARIMVGEAELLREDSAAALAEWRRGYEETRSAVFLRRIEDHFIERAEPERAIETLRSMIAATDGAAESATLPRFFLGRLYYRLEMHEEALKMLEGVAERIGKAPTYHFLLARIHERRGEMRRAVTSFAACAEQLGVFLANYVCRVCRRQHEEWNDRCAACGTWNSTEVDLEEEKLPALNLAAPAPPVQRGDDSGEWSVSGQR